MNNAFDLLSGNALNVNNGPKLLNSTFDTFAEAYSAFADFVGNNCDDIHIGQMVRHFLTANQQPIFRIDTSEFITNPAYYFESTEWLSAFMTRNNFFQFDDDQFIAVDSGNRPVGYIRVKSDNRRLLVIEGRMSKAVYFDLISSIEKNIKIDHQSGETEIKHNYLEAVLDEGPSLFSSKPSLRLVEKTMAHSGETKLAFYPYLNGGIVSLIEDFIQSDETVLILMGEPGTGKSTAISSAAVALNLLPIYAKKTEVITDPSFVSKIFEFSDHHMERIAIETGSSPRQDLFKDRSHFDKANIDINLPPVIATSEKKKKSPAFPVIIIEDGDLLLKPRSEGNTLMSELLNETDGVGSTVTRKMIITTNITDKSKIDSALMRDGRHYLGEPLHFRMLSPMEAIEARAAGGLPPFETVPVSDIPLATALRKPRKKIYLRDGEIVIGKNNTLN